jgi:NTP pyrophosphatase (non-canonical NTP hydrolase)
MNLKFEDLELLAKSLDAELYGDIGNESLFVYLEEELAELKQRNYPNSIEEKLNQVEEFGDVMFCLIAYARQNNIDVNYALAITICKLQDRIKRGQ